MATFIPQTPSLANQSAPGLVPALPAGLEPTGKVLRDSLQWAQPAGEPQYELLLSDVANTSGPIAGSVADTGQTWLASGDGATSPKFPFYASDAVGGYMRASDQGGVVNTYIFGDLGSQKCQRLRSFERGTMATLAILSTPGSLADMVHVNITQATGAVYASYWKTGVGADQQFRVNWSQGNPVADPLQPRLYEIQVVDDHIITYVDGKLAGVASDPVIKDLIGPGFFVQLHDANKRIYEVNAWTDAVDPAASVASPSLAVDKSRVTDTEYLRTEILHAGNATASGYSPSSGCYIFHPTPTFRGANIVALIRSLGTGEGAELRIRNGEFNLGLDIVAGGDVVGRIRHQGTDRLTFPANIGRVDLSRPIRLNNLATDPGTEIGGAVGVNGVLFYSTAAHRARLFANGAFVNLATTADLTPATGTALATTGTVNLDMAVLDNTLQTITLTGNLTLTTSNRAAGRSVVLRLIEPGTASRTVTLPAWRIVGAAMPQLNNNLVLIRLTFFAASDTDAVAEIMSSV